MRLRELRKAKGLRQKDIAEILGVSPQSYGYYENGINKPDPDTLIKLANFFECSIDFLLGREDDFGNITIQTATPSALPQDEQNLLDVYRKLDTVNKMHVSAYAEVRLEEQEKSSFSKVRKK